MGGSAVVGAEAFRRAQVLRPEPWLRSSSPLLSKRHTRWRVRSDANSAEVTRYVDQCVPVKLEKVPMELLILLLEKDGHLVTRQQIIERLWGNDVFVDTEHGINTAICKIRLALKDDPDRPRFVQTVTGKGYRFVAELRNGNRAASTSQHEEAPVSETGISVGRNWAGHLRLPHAQCWRYFPSKTSAETLARNISVMGSPRK